MMLKLPRFVRFLGCRHAPTTPSLGLLFNGDVVDVYQLLTREIQSEGLLQQATMEELVHGAWAKQKTRAFIDEIVDDFHRQNLPQESIMGSSEVRILSPVTPPRNVMCVGKNYTDHIAEVAAVRKGDELNEAPKYPVFFTKAPECVVAGGETVPAHSNLTKWLDYEVELALVIGKEGKDIAKDEVSEYIFGYTIANDVTARELQKSHKQWFKGKSLDRTCPIGPCIVPASHLDASDLGVKCYVNDELRQDSRTSKMVFDIPSIVASLSQGFTLKPGDCILTGTPDGVGFAMNPPQVLIAGDKMVCEIEQIGSLTNTISET